MPLLNLLRTLWLRWSVLLLPGAVILAAFALHVPAIRDDEAWIAEPAYWLMQQGVVRSVLWEGYFLHEQQILVHHFLFVRLTAWLLHVLPWHILSLRLLPFAGGLLTAFALMVFARNRYHWPNRQVLGAGALFLLLPLNFEYLTYYRPEFIVTLFGFGSFWALHREERSWWHTALAGALAGAAMLVHLNGLIFALAGGVLLLWERQWKQTLLFGLAAVLAFLPYLVVILQDLEMFRYQLTSGANSGGQHWRWYSPFINLLEEHKRLFRGPYTIFTSAFAIAALLVLRKDPGRDTFLIRYLLVLVAMLGLIAVSKTSQYSMLYYPHVALLLTAALRVAPAKWAALRKAIRVFFLLTATLFTAFCFGAVGYLLLPQPNTAAINARIAQHLPEGKVCVAPMTFVFNEIDDYKIVTITALYEGQGKQMTLADVLRFCRERKAPYLVLNKFWKEKVKDWPEDEAQLQPQLEEVTEVEGYTLYRLQ